MPNLRATPPPAWTVAGAPRRLADAVHAHFNPRRLLLLLLRGSRSGTSDQPQSDDRMLRGAHRIQRSRARHSASV
jgi:hypothetical protein